MVVILAGCFAVVSGAAAWPRAGFAQGVAVPAASPQAVATDEELLSQAQLEQLLAPIALFPDELLMQVLMAATYPIEIVQAKRWLAQGQNAALRGDALVRALEPLPWDPSVKSLTPFPDVLGLMNDQLDWTQQLGDAVLAQQEDVLNAVQVLRGRAQAAGQLQSGPQIIVNVTHQTVQAAPTARVAPPPQIITIAPAQPDVIFVPVFNPTVVYGAWPHPGFPPAYFPPPLGWGMGNALLTGMAFATGAAVVGSLWGWAQPGWGRGNVNVNVNQFNSINVNRTQISNNNWRHDVTHRGGAAYSNRRVNNDFRGANAGRADSRDQFRGRLNEVERGGRIGDSRPGGNRPGGGDRPGFADGRPGGSASRPGGGDRPDFGTGNRPGNGDRPSLGATRPNVGDRPNIGNGNRPGSGDRPSLGVDRPGGGDRPNLRNDNRPGGGERPSLGGDRPNLGTSTRPGSGDRPNAGNRPGSAERPNAGVGNRPGGGERPSLSDSRPTTRPGTGQTPNIQRPATLPSGRPQVPQNRPQTREAPRALQGVGGQGAQTRAAGQRGEASRAAQPAARQQPRNPPASRPQAGQRGGGDSRGGGGGRAAAARAGRN